MFIYPAKDIYFKDGECKSLIDPIFSEVVNLDNYYHVFISKYGKGDIGVAEQTKDYFSSM